MVDPVVLPVKAMLAFALFAIGKAWRDEADPRKKHKLLVLAVIVGAFLVVL